MSKKIVDIRICEEYDMVEIIGDMGECLFYGNIDDLYSIEEITKLLVGVGINVNTEHVEPEEFDI